MPENIRAYLVVLALSTITFALMRAPARLIGHDADFIRRRNLWLLVTSLAFLAHNFWLFAAGAAVALSTQIKHEHNPLALWWLLLLAVPAFGMPIPGLGVVNYLFELTYPRLLSLFVLLPAALVLLANQENTRLGQLWTDRLLLAYLLLNTLLYIRDTTFTDTLRAAFMYLLDVLLPYFVASRWLLNKTHIKDVLLTMLLGAGVMCAIAFFEFAKGWLLYSPLKAALGVPFGMGGYLTRDGALRASGSTGQAIVMGYVGLLALGAFLYLRHWVTQPHWRWLGGLLVLGGLVAPLSRGPWVGAVALLVFYAVTAAQAGKKLLWLAAGFAALVPVLMLVKTSSGQAAIELLPFIGKNEQFNVDYRERLMEMSSIVIERNFWFGSVDYRSTPEMQSMIQGQGIIDIVNTYIGVALETGITGLALFVGFFALVLASTFRRMTRFKKIDIDPESAIMGQTLVATLMGLLVCVYTVSSISVIPLIYWAFAGVCVAYSRLQPTHTQVFASTE